MQTEGNILNVHQAASNGDPREVKIESTCTSYLHTQIYFLMHTYYSNNQKNGNEGKSREVKYFIITLKFLSIMNDGQAQL